MKGCLALAALLGAFALGLTGATALQEGGMDGGDAKGDDQGMQHPPPLEDPNLDRLIGTWEWTGKMWMGGQEMPMRSEQTYEWVLGHQFVLGHYKSFGPDGSVVFEGMGVTRSDPEKKTDTTWWFDVSGEGQRYEGVRDGDTVKAEWAGPAGKSRSVVTVREDGTATSKMESLMPGQTEWQRFFEVEGKKKK